MHCLLNFKDLHCLDINYFISYVGSSKHAMEGIAHKNYLDIINQGNHI